MFESIKETLVTWNSKNDERAKLQQAYVAIAVIMLIVAGLVGLLNRDLGQNLLLIAIISAGMFLVNAVVWSLLQSALLARLTVRRAASTRKK
jgi:cell division protein FtsW (lipid II flippase)